MLESYFESTTRLRQLRRGPLADHIDGLAEALRAAGYTRSSGRMLLSLVGKFSQFARLSGVTEAPDRGMIQGQRDHALLLFLGRTGARVSEAIAVNARDLRLERPWQVLLRGKGAKERIVPIGEDTAAVLRALVQLRAESRPDSPVFVNARGCRLTRFGVTHILRRAVKRAAFRRPCLAERAISPHTLRHTKAMHLLQSGVDLTTIQSWLGHVSVVTTDHYLQADVEMKRRALAKCDIPEAAPLRYEPSDELLALLDRL